MKKVYGIGLIFVFVVLLSFVVISQQPSVEKVRHSEQITENIALKTEDSCVTEFYEEVSEIRGTCTYYHNYTLCVNSTGPDTDCSQKQTERMFSCITSTQTTLKNKTTCRPDNKFLITINDGNAILEKQIDHSDWGPCQYQQQNGCLVVECVSYNDGAHNGQFIPCRSGMSCQKFEICENSTKTYYRNSQDDYTAEDESFYLPALEVKEVGE